MGTSVNRDVQKQKLYQQAYYTTNRRKLIRDSLARRYEVAYGITEEQYKKILIRQKGVCALCKVVPKTKRLSVDHDHVSKRVRGLLCHQCNHYLIGRYRVGHLFRKAAAYLDAKFDGRNI